MTTSESTPGAAVATSRLPGIDVARALAVLGMVLVNYKLKMEAASRGPDWLVWLSSLMDGRAAALFVVLAGIGISLRSHRAREHREQLPVERISLLKRAAFLFVAGLLNLHLWEWDILHFYGIYLAIAAWLLTLRTNLLWLAAVFFVVVDIVLPEFEVDPNVNSWALLWSPSGMMMDLFVNGLHAVFPWMAFLCVGMWLGRQDLSDFRRCRHLLAAALVLMIGCAVFYGIEIYVIETLNRNEPGTQWMGLIFLFSPTLFVLSSTAMSIIVICLCIPAVQPHAERRWVMALVATGQLAFTLYIAHAIAILIPLQHGLLEGGSLTLSIGYSLAFYVVAVMLCVWWRRRWPYGPLEGLIRQITGRTTPAPWGGERLPPRIGPVAR